MASIADILRTIQVQITNGINAYGIKAPGQVVIGWPTGPQLESEIGNLEWLVSIYPLKSHPTTRYRPQLTMLSHIPPSPLQATVTQGLTYTTIAISGANIPGLNIHTVFGPPSGRLDAYYPTTGLESIPQIAVNVAALINSYAVPGISATPVGQNVLVTGPWRIWCNIGQSYTFQPGAPAFAVQEIGRFEREIQITIWSSSPDQFAPVNDGTRENLEAAMLISIGGTGNEWLFAPDGAAFLALWSSTGDWSDKAESSYSIFKSINYLKIEYGLLVPLPITTIGAVQETVQIANQPSITEYIGGT